MGEMEVNWPDVTREGDQRRVTDLDGFAGRLKDAFLGVSRPVGPSGPDIDYDLEDRFVGVD